MKKVAGVLIGMVMLLGLTCAMADDLTIRWTWQHSIPLDIAKYTVYELSGPNGSKTGQTYPLLYSYEGVSEKTFTHSAVIQIPVGVHVQKCYVVTASDISNNESANSVEACGDAYIPDTIAPPACRSLDITFEK